MRGRRRPVAGAIAGFFFGLFLAATLLVFGVIPLKSPLVTILPAAFIVLGALWGYWAPIGRRPVVEPETSALVRPATPTTPRPLGGDPSVPPVAPAPVAEPPVRPATIPEAPVAPPTPPPIEGS